MATRTEKRGIFTYAKCADCKKEIIVSVNTKGMADKEMRAAISKMDGGKDEKGVIHCTTCAYKVGAEKEKKDLDIAIKGVLSKVTKVYPCPACQLAYTERPVKFFDTKEELERHLRSTHTGYYDIKEMLKYGGRKRNNY